ncbi:MAG: ABC transporter ATP-binding protein [Candidatus Babeliales bacterium]|jgi:putative ABC transport system ATP-binding protein
MNTPTIECKNITMRFGTQTNETSALRGVNLVAHEGELILLMGPSGSGKTTLISIIGGLLQQTSGECLILNTPLNTLPDKEKTIFRGKNIGFLFQYFTLVPTLNPLENVAIPLILNGVNRDQAFEEARKILQSMDLGARLYNKIDTLSGGEQQRVAAARAFIHRPRIILCDEPTSFLDHERGKQVMELLRSIKKETNCTLIVVTHDPRILPFADTILEIEDGYIKQQSTPTIQPDKPTT